MTGIFKDPLNDKHVTVYLKLNTSLNQLSWKAAPIGLIRATNSVPIPGITLPTDMTFIRL